MRLCIRIREWLRFQLTQERIDTKVPLAGAPRHSSHDSEDAACKKPLA